jgi:hypothetical protein
MSRLTNVREKKTNQIFIILTSKNNPDDKNQYCNNHAKERAEIIEDTLYKNCYNIHGNNCLELYESIDPCTLVEHVEQKTTVCVFNLT